MTEQDEIALEANEELLIASTSADVLIPAAADAISAGDQSPAEAPPALRGRREIMIEHDLIAQEALEEIKDRAAQAASLGIRFEGNSVRTSTYTDYRSVRSLSPFELLANAIVIEAIRDYRRLRKHGILPELPTMSIESLERFFRSRWFGVLTSIDPELLIKYLREEKGRR